MNDSFIIEIGEKSPQDELQDKSYAEMKDSFIIEIDEKSPQDESQGKSYDGSSINTMKISPNGKYFIIYNNKDETIVGDVIREGIDIKEDEYLKEKKDLKEGEYFKIDIKVSDDKLQPVKKRVIYHMCVSDEKILAYIYDDHDIG